MKKLVVGLALAAGLVLPAAGTNYYWNVTVGGNWNGTTMWNPTGSYPQSGDDANFTGAVAQAVVLNGNQAATTVNVSDSAAWTFNAAANTATVSAAFNYSDTATSTFNSALSGAMALNVTAGRLLLSNAGNSNLSGGIVIKGGTLVAALQSGALQGTLGNTNQTITIGDPAVSADSALELYGNNSPATYAQPIVIPAGPGKAYLIGSKYNNADNNVGIILTGGITLSDELTLFNNTQRASGYGDRRAFQVTGAIGGTGNIVKDGVGIVQFDGNNSYSGTTTVKNGWLNLASGTHTYTGAIRVDGGMLIVNTDARLGNANNTIRLGSSGRFGILRADTAALTTSRAITLDGNGGILGDFQQNFTFNGPIGGSGRLAVDLDGFNVYLYGTNSYSGGTKVYMGRVVARNSATAATALGTGNVIVDNGLLTISGANSVNVGASVLVNGSGTFSIPANITTVPTIATNSSGRLGFFGTSGAAVNTRLASPIGNGYMFIASTIDDNDLNAGFTFNGTNLAIGADNTYRFIPGSYGVSLDTPTTTGVLVDNGVTPANVLCGVGDIVGNWLRSKDAQTFTGTLTVKNCIYGAFALTSGSTMGGSGPVSLVKGVLDFDGNSVNGAAPIIKGALTNEAASQVYLHQNGGNGISLTVASLNRANNGCLQIWGSSTANLGAGEKFIVTAAPVSAGGMVAPHMTIHSAATDGNQDFANYAAPNGFTNVVYTIAGTPGTVISQANFDSTVAADIVKVTNTDVSISAPKTLQALKTSMAVTGAGNTLTLTSGGLILTGAAKTNSVNLATAGELVITVGGTAIGNQTRNTLSGTVTAAGLTKTGKGTLVLGADNTTTLTGGDVTVDQGNLEISNDNQLGAAANRIILNNIGGTFGDGLRSCGTLALLPATRTIVLGANGGVIYADSTSLTIAGTITGPGGLAIWSQIGITITNPNNDYTGGTSLSGSLTLNGGQLGTGPVTIQGLTISDNIYHPNRFILGNSSSGSKIQFSGTAPQVGSLEGGIQYASAGQQCVFLNTANSVLTLGGNDQSTDLFAAIMDSDNGAGTYGNSGIVKTGVGTFTMWGLNTYHGTTVVTNGTIVVNNLINTNGVVMVYPGATLDGIGTVGIVSNLGGTVKGKLYTSGLTQGAGAVLQIALNGAAGNGTNDVVTVNGPVNLTGSTLTLALNFAPTSGQTFMILNNTSAGTIKIVGQFACGHKVSAIFGSKTYWFTINYNGGDGNDIVLTCIPSGTVFSAH